ncbi:MAG: glycosyltransferase [Prosthecochloris sp.]|nr:glycosyltransferase [Prosthecochloris sp.]
MRVSVITVSYNAVNTIEDTIRSVVSQDYHDIEYILVDGFSCDGTVEIINKYSQFIYNFISEPDSGIYDAMNKGIFNATGDIISILNADDVYATESVLSDVVKVFETKGVDVVYGNVNMVARDDLTRIIRFWPTSSFFPGSFRKAWHPPHPGLFVASKVYEMYGAYDLDYGVSADFEFMLRIFEKYNVSSFCLDKLMVKMRYGGESTKSIRNIFNGNINIYKAFRKNSISYPFYYPVIRFINKLFQFFYR